MAGGGLKRTLQIRVQKLLQHAGEGLLTPDDVRDRLMKLYPEYNRHARNVLMPTIVDELAKHRQSGGSAAAGSKRQRTDSEDEGLQEQNFLGTDGSQISSNGKKAVSLNESILKGYKSGSQSSPAPSGVRESSATDGTPRASEKDESDRNKPKRRNRGMQKAGGGILGGGGSRTDFGLCEVPPSVRYDNIGGIDTCIQDVRELVEWPLLHPEIYFELGVKPPRGVLLTGPPGSGKTMLVNAIAGELSQCNVTFVKISAPEIVSGMSGESEEKLRSLFETAKAHAPALLFLDEIDSITPKREQAQREMERRIVSQLLTCMDELDNCGPEASVLVMGATNRADSLDSALRRAGRFDREILMGVPDEGARVKILQVLCDGLKIEGDLHFELIAKKTPGFVGADLAALTKEAATVAVNRIFHNLNSSVKALPTEDNSSNSTIDSALTGAHHTDSMDGENDAHHSSIEGRKASSSFLRNFSGRLPQEQLSELSISMGDFEQAIPKVQPSSKREGFATVPGVTWDDVGALQDVREELDMAITQPILHPARFQRLGLSSPAGVLLYGPPGCGKTLVAKAVSNQSGANFISVKGPELLNKFVGESEKAVRTVFQRARASKPCVVFFDELDALCPRRGSDSSSSSSERVVNQLLTEMDGLEDREGVFIIGATNRPDMIDSAMLRPGRLEKLLLVPLPDKPGRQSVLESACRKLPLSQDINLAAIAEDSRADGFSGADLASLVRQAAHNALRSCGVGSQDADDVLISHRHFDQALDIVLPSVTKGHEARYNALKSKLRQSRAAPLSGN